MKLSKAIDIRIKAMESIHEKFMFAKSFRWSSQLLNDELAIVFKMLPTGIPGWVRSYLHGVSDVLRRQIFQNDLEFCYIKDDKLYSVVKSLPRYYEKLGVKVKELTDLPNGFFWRDSTQPYFIGS